MPCTIIRSKASAARTLVTSVAMQSRRLASRKFSTYYYDSQSGMHVPVHNVNEISIILDKSQEDTNLSTSFVPAQLYKEDASSDMPDKLANLHAQLGVRGIILPPISFPRDVRNLLTLRNIAPSPDFLYFAAASDIQSASPVLKDPHFSLILNFDADNGGEVSNVIQENRVHTTLALRNVGQEDENPISIANQVAAWIDQTRGGDYIWVPTAKGDTDALERLCQELSYLDLVGKTVASRLIIGGGGGSNSSVNEDLVEETMFAGVNKFVVCQEEDVSVISEIAESQGKSIVIE